MDVTQTVLVTRPEPGASATARRLVAMGYAPIVLPLTEIVPRKPSEPIIPHLHEAIALTSANAVRHAAREIIESLLQKPVFAVGDSTAQAAREAGFTDVRVAGGTARHLAALIAEGTLPAARILHLAGTDRTQGFDTAVTASGRHITTIETYAAEKISYPTDFILKQMKGASIDHALVFSTRAANLLAELATRTGLRERFETTRFLCISAQAAASLAEIASDRIAVSNQPSEDGVVLLLSADGRA